MPALFVGHGSPVSAIEDNTLELKGALTMLGMKLLKSGGNVTLVVDNLEKRGLVRRRGGVADRRRVTVHLTSPGRCLIRAAFARVLPRIVAEMSALGAAEQERLRRLCHKLGRRTDRTKIPNPKEDAP